MSDPIPFATPQQWSDWLAANHAIETEVWLLLYRKRSGTPSIDWRQAVIEALCWGWIDGVKNSRDATRWTQRFTPRKPRSNWSQINVAHVGRLIAEGRMQPAGLIHVTAAQADGRWDAAYCGGKNADQPEDFLTALAAASDTARATYATLDRRNRYGIYYRLTTAKRSETRAKRIADFIDKLTRGAPIL